jgi:hypothetical protein
MDITTAGNSVSAYPQRMAISVGSVGTRYRHQLYGWVAVLSGINAT